MKIGNKESYILGVDIGGTKTAVSISSFEGAIIKKRRFPTKGRSEDVVQAIISEIDYFCSSYRRDGIKAIGISCGGPLDHIKGVILSPPNLPGWDGVPITQLLTKASGLPCFLQNDANACALAEWYWGAGRGYANMIFLTFGTGLGAGLILDGKLYTGSSGMAGEVGHIRLAETGSEGFGKIGSFEGFCSGGGLSRRYESLFNEKLTAKEICSRAKLNDKKSLQIIEESSRFLGHGISILIDTLNPQRVIIGSIFSRSETLFRPVMERVLKEETLNVPYRDCKIVPSGLGENLGDMAAVGVGLNGLKRMGDYEY